MAQRLNVVVLSAVVVVVVAGLLQSCGAQPRHVVGDALGWNIPPGGPIAYSTWASRNTFTVGDILVFNFTTGQHDVAEVTKSAFDTCNVTSPLSISTTGPTNITLASAGEHHFLCTINGHCNLGQKLAINVSAAASPAPTPAPTPSPPNAAPTPALVSTPAPAPSRAAMTYVVGDGLGWNVLPAGAAAYRTWADNKTFMVGDTIVFNFANGTHDVAELTKAAYDSCNTTNTLSLITISPARITLTTAGQHFFTCTFPRHCSLGQQLAITVTATTSASPPPASTPATPPTTPSPSPATPPSSPTATPPSTSTTPSPSSGGAATPPSTSTTPSPSGGGAATPPSTSTTPSPSGTTTTSPPPPGSSAPSFAVAAMPLTLLSIAVAFLLH